MFAQEPTTTAPGSEAPPPTGKSGGVNAVVKEPSFIVWSLVLAGILLLAAVLFLFFDRWRKRPTGETARDTAAGFGSFREMYENGELTEAEYERIRAKMAAKLLEKAGVPPPSPRPNGEPKAPPAGPPAPPPPDPAG